MKKIAIPLSLVLAGLGVSHYSFASQSSSADYATTLNFIKEHGGGWSDYWFATVEEVEHCVLDFTKTTVSADWKGNVDRDRHLTSSTYRIPFSAILPDQFEPNNRHRKIAFNFATDGSQLIVHTYKILGDPNKFSLSHLLKEKFERQPIQQGDQFQEIVAYQRYLLTGSQAEYQRKYTPLHRALLRFAELCGRSVSGETNFGAFD